MGARTRLAEVALGVSTVAALPAAGAGDIPPRALQAYVTAAASAEACPGMRWQIPAAVTDRESDHGRHGGSTLDADGVASPPIYGVPIDWLGGVRAEGPGQFIPSSWDLFGKGDPQDIDDTAMAIVRHLCGTHGDVEGDHLRSALVSYYGADQDGYADGVLAAIADLDRVEPALFAASQTVAPKPKQRTPMRLWDGLVARWVRAGDGAEAVGLGGVWRAVDDAMFGREVKVQRAVAARPDRLDPTFGANLDRFIAAAPGAITVVSGFRDSGEQLALRRQNCPDALLSDSTECTPWTAKPGTSDHERGLAADLSYGNDATERWAHANAARFELQYDVETEPWHISLVR